MAGPSDFGLTHWSASLLRFSLIVTVYQNQWMTPVEHDGIRTDPTRMVKAS
jgi:hypothetical protein